MMTRTEAMTEAMTEQEKMANRQVMTHPATMKSTDASEGSVKLERLTQGAATGLKADGTSVAMDMAMTTSTNTSMMMNTNIMQLLPLLLKKHSESKSCHVDGYIDDADMWHLQQCHVVAHAVGPSRYFLCW